MTSLAFAAGVLPLAVSSGAGANGRIAIGTGIVGGTLAATALGIFFVPLFFTLVGRGFEGKRSERPQHGTDSAAAAARPQRASG
jgi:multidrug efflux pump